MSEEELAELAEVEPAFVRRAMRAGALAAGGPGGFGAQDATRLRFLRAWDAAGLPVEAIADLVGRGQLPLTFLVGPTVDPRPRLASTYQELCAERGIGLPTVQRLHDALGFGPPAPSDRARADDLVMVELLEQLIGAGAEEAAVLRLLRVYADALRRLTQAEAELYEAQVERRLREAGATEQDLLERGGAAGARVPPLLEEVLVAVYRRHRQHVWLDHSIGHVERILEANGLHRRLDRPPCVCFVDLTGYTRLTAERGDEAAAELAGRLAALIEGISRGWAGRPVRWLGDGGMFVFREPADAVRAPSGWSPRPQGPACPRPTSASTAARWCSRTATSTAPPSTSPPACPPEPPRARSWSAAPPPTASPTQPPRAPGPGRAQGRRPAPGGVPGARRGVTCSSDRIEPSRSVASAIEPTTQCRSEPPWAIRRMRSPPASRHALTTTT